MSAIDLYWLPSACDWDSRLEALGDHTAGAFVELVSLAKSRLSPTATAQLDRALQRHMRAVAYAGTLGEPIRLALLGSSTLSHLTAALRVAALRRGILLETYECAFGQYLQELSDPRSPLHSFHPTVVLFAFDAEHLTRTLDANADATAASEVTAAVLEHLRGCWAMARDAFRCDILQQTVLLTIPPIAGSNEHRVSASRKQMVTRLNFGLRELADAEGIDLVAVDERAAADGVWQWHDSPFWHYAKQEISTKAAPLYGELVLRVIAARLGRSSKCLVFDLDDTVWGGTVGEDGVGGLILGQGTALGEAFVAFQRHLKQLARRGVILAVCSKNDEATALSAFATHPEMVLRRTDVASFVANWDEKAANMRLIADQLAIGLDSMVFVDNDPFERARMRTALPMVATPELPDEPAAYALALADAGYFESVAITAEDRQRTSFYQTAVEVRKKQAQAADMSSYLESLQMELVWGEIDQDSLKRSAQLINKTNQFNLTTRRYTEDELLALRGNSDVLALSFRLVDRFGDQGIIAVVIVRLSSQDTSVIDTWLMSCRVIGRRVEEATLAAVIAEVRRRGAKSLVGEYRATARNGLVANLYETLGFQPSGSQGPGERLFELDVATATLSILPIRLRGP